MTRQNRKTEDRQKALEGTPPEGSITLAGVRDMYAGIRGREFRCTISGYIRTRVFEFPGLNFLPEGAEPFREIYNAPQIRACLVSGLSGYFNNSTRNQHYAMNSALQHDVGETEEKNKQSQEGRAPVYLVVEESNQLSPVTMVNGECCIADEVIVKDGERIPIAIGGREGEQFITAWDTVDGNVARATQQ